MEDQCQLILMAPLRRCGSHAIRLRLSASPEFFSPYPLHPMDMGHLQKFYGNLNNDKNYYQLTVDMIGLLSQSLVKWPHLLPDPNEFFEKIKSLPREFLTPACELLKDAAQGKRVVMDKSLDNIQQWESLFKIYPDLKILNVVRDPRAQISSMNLAIIHEFDTLLNSDLWLKAHECMDAAMARYPRAVKTIRYEDFVQNEEVVLRQICDFLEIEFLPAMLEIQKSSEARVIAQQSDLWKFNAFPLIPAHIDKFKKNLTMREIQLIETLCWPKMQQYGYERISKADLKVTQTLRRQARQKSEKEKQLAWARLKKTNYHDFVLRRRRADFIKMCEKNIKP